MGRGREREDAWGRGDWIQIQGRKERHGLPGGDWATMKIHEMF